MPMSKLSSKQQDILRLIMRSNADYDRWYHVSNVVWPLVDGTMPSDLVELRPHKNGGVVSGGHLRLTERGQAVADYL